MPLKFSPQLIERLQRHFRERFDVEVSDEKAEEYLHSLAELFGLFTDLPD